MQKESLIPALASAERAMDIHLNKAGSSLLIYKIKKAIRHPYRSMRLAAFKKGLVADSGAWAKTFSGVALFVPLSDVNAADLYYAGCLRASEGYVTRFLMNTVRPGTVFYDIGANYGYYSVLALSLGAEVHAFEPSLHCLAYLRVSIAAHSEKAHMNLNPAALSDVSGSIDFFDTSEGHKSGMSTIEERVAESNKMAYQKRLVSVTTLDTYARSHPVPTVIKIDTEGSEAKVIAGAQKLLADQSPIIVMEIWESPQGIENSRAILRLLQKAGYVPHEIAEDGSIHPRDINFGEIGENNNFVFKKASGHVV